MHWFKLYTEARNDAKLRSLTDAQHRVWFNLLCFAAEQPQRGIIGVMTLKRLAAEVAKNDEDLLIGVLELCNALQVVTCRYTSLQVVTSPLQPLQPVTGVVTQGVEVVFLNFEKRQHVTPSASRDRVRERVAKHREAKRSGNQENPCNGGNDPVTESNGAVTGYIGVTSTQNPVTAPLELELELEERKKRAPTKSEAPIPKPTEFRPDFDRTKPTVTGPGRDSTDAIELAKWTEHLGCDDRGESYAVWARHACDTIPVAWLHALLEDKVKGRTNPVGLSYLNTVLKDWCAKGSCPLLNRRANRSSAAASAPAPTSSPQFTDEERAAMQQRRANQRAKAAEGKS